MPKNDDSAHLETEGAGSEVEERKAAIKPAVMPIRRTLQHSVEPQNFRTPSDDRPGASKFHLVHLVNMNLSVKKSFVKSDSEDVPNLLPVEERCRGGRKGLVAK